MKPARSFHAFLTATMVVMALALSACASVPQPKTFNERLAYGYTTVTTIRQIGTNLVTAGKISANDAQNVQDQANNARVGLDIAKTLSGQAAEDKLTVTLTLLQGLQSYLLAKENGGK